MHNSKRIRRMIIAIALIIVILLGLDYNTVLPATLDARQGGMLSISGKKEKGKDIFEIFSNTEKGRMDAERGGACWNRFL